MSGRHLMADLDEDVKVTVKVPEELRARDRAREEGSRADEPTAALVPFTEIAAHRVEWLWEERIALGKITALSGRPKIGKGLLYSELAAAVTQGRLGGALTEPRDVILITTEDDPGDTLKPRLMAAEADLERVSLLVMGSKDDPVPFRVPGDASKLAELAVASKAALVVIDPLIEFIDGSLDTHKSHAVRQAFASLNPIARETGCAILAIIHLNKGASTDTHLRHEASAAFTQVVRGGLLLGRDPDDPDGETGDQRVLAVSSSNLARIPPALVYRIETAVVDGDDGLPIETAKAVHIGESSAESHDLLRGHDPDERTERDEAHAYLLAELADGPKPSRQLIGGAPCSKRTLMRAKAELGIVSRKSAFGSGWQWELPEGCQAKSASPTPSPVASFAETASDSGKDDLTAAKDATPSGVASFGESRPVTRAPTEQDAARFEAIGRRIDLDSPPAVVYGPNGDVESTADRMRQMGLEPTEDEA